MIMSIAKSPSFGAALVMAAATLAGVAVVCWVGAAYAQAADGGAGGGHGKAQFLTSYDIDGDSIVSRAEYETRRSEQFARADADSAEAVSESEYVGEYAARLDQDLAATRERQIAQAHVRFGVLDTNDDGRISREEFDASGGRIFSRLDTNGDGAVDEHDTAESY